MFRTPLQGQATGYVALEATRERAECGLQKVIRISTLIVAALRHYPMSRPKFAAPSRATAIKGGIRPARERFTLDGREHDGSLAISRATVCLMAIFASSMLFEWSSAGRTSVIDHTASSCASYKSLCGFCHRSVPTFRGTGTLETRIGAHRKRRQITNAITEGRHGADADQNSPAYGRPTHSMHAEYSPSVRTVVDLSALVPHSSNLFVRRASEIRSQ